MGVIKGRYTSQHKFLVERKIFDEYVDGLVETGCDRDLVRVIAEKVTEDAARQSKGKFTLMGGYSPVEQLFEAAEKLLRQYDQDGTIDNLFDKQQEQKKKDKKLRETFDIEDHEPNQKYSAESDVEDVYAWLEATRFIGSPKQVKWAKDIVSRNPDVVISAWERREEPNTSSKWWIENYA